MTQRISWTKKIEISKSMEITTLKMLLAHKSTPHRGNPKSNLCRTSPFAARGLDQARFNFHTKKTHVSKALINSLYHLELAAATTTTTTKIKTTTKKRRFAWNQDIFFPIFPKTSFFWRHDFCGKFFSIHRTPISQDQKSGHTAILECLKSFY